MTGKNGGLRKGTVSDLQKNTTISTDSKGSLTKNDAASVLAVLSAGVGVSVTKEQAEVYYSALRDIDAETLREACRRALLLHEYRSLPPVGLIRREAMELIHGRVPGVDQAWDMVQRMVRVWDQYEPERCRKALAALVEPVQTVVKRFGAGAIVSGEIEFPQFRDAYQRCVAEIQRDRLLGGA